MPHANREKELERENQKRIFNKLVNIGVVLTLAILVSKMTKYVSESEEVKKFAGAHAGFNYIWGTLALASVAIVILVCVQIFSGKKIILLNKKENISRGSDGKMIASLIGVAFIALLIIACYYLLQAAATSQAQRGLLATQGWREPPKVQKPRVVRIEKSFILQPGELSEPIKVDGTEDFWIEPLAPETISGRDVSILRYYHNNGGSSIITNRLGDKIDYVIGFTMRVKSERKIGPLHLEVAVGKQ